jgi:hypothetical protein
MDRVRRNLRRAACILFMAAFTSIASAQENPETPLRDAPPPLSSGEQVQVIEKARELALQYTANLPNFICTETIQRYNMQKSAQSWKSQDTITLDVAFSEKGESYRMLTFNGKPTNKSFRSVDGFKSDGEFGTILDWIFRPKSNTKFQWQRWASLRGRPVHVFSYRIEKAASQYQVAFSSLLKRHRGIFAFSGLVYVDRENNQVLRLTHAPEGIPKDWPAIDVPAELDYGFAEIGGQQFLLPLRAEMRVLLRNGEQSRNVMEFSNYRKFSSEATLKFELP